MTTSKTTYCSHAAGLQQDGAMCREYRHRVPYSDCATCDMWDGAPRGAGDWVHAITSRLRIPHCLGCAARRRALNSIIPTSTGSQLTQPQKGTEQA